jgi:putative hydrolase of the HAD superfamily
MPDLAERLIPMKLKAILFDLGGTLIQTPEVSEIMQQTLEAKGILRSVEEVDRAKEEADKHMGGYKELPSLREKFWVKWNAKILEKLGIHKDQKVLATYIFESWWDHAHARLFPEVTKVLQQLRDRGLKLGIITNGLKSDIDKLLPQVGLNNEFDTVVVIDLVGKMKPDKAIFHHALKQLDVKPNEALFIGDRIEEDYNGAKNAGIKALLIDRENKTIEKNVDKIQSLEEIFEKLEMP